MKLKDLNRVNLQKALGSRAKTALEFFDNNKYEELEELLRVEFQSAQDKSIILNKMYTEVSTLNLQNELMEEAFDEES